MSYTLIIPEELYEQLYEIRKVTGESVVQQIFGAIQYHINQAKEDCFCLEKLA